MSSAEIAWSFGLLGVVLAARFLVVQMRRRTRDYHEARAVKGRLPVWAAGIERSLLYGLTIVVSGVVFLAFTQHYRSAGLRHEIAGATLVFAAAGSVLIAMPVAGLLANLVSWLAPALRNANKAAMSGSTISFSSANRGLLMLGAATAPAGLAVLAVAAFAPWAR